MRRNAAAIGVADAFEAMGIWFALNLYGQVNVFYPPELRGTVLDHPAIERVHVAVQRALPTIKVELEARALLAARPPSGATSSRHREPRDLYPGEVMTIHFGRGENAVFVGVGEVHPAPVGWVRNQRQAQKFGKQKFAEMQSAAASAAAKDGSQQKERSHAGPVTEEE